MKHFIYFSLTYCVFIWVLTKDLLVFLTCPPPNTVTPFLTHTHTCSPIYSSYLHISILFILHPLSLSLPFSHTHQHTSIMVMSNTLHINSAAVLPTSPLFLPNILSVFLRASQEMSFIKLESAHRKNPKHPEETKRGQTSTQPDTHTLFFKRTILLFQPCCPNYRPLEMGNFRISGSGAIRIPCRAPKQCSYSCNKETNIIKLLIRSLKEPSLAQGWSQEAKGNSLWGMRKWKAVCLRVAAFSHTVEGVCPRNGIWQLLWHGETQLLEMTQKLLIGNISLVNICYHCLVQEEHYKLTI